MRSRSPLLLAAVLPAFAAAAFAFPLWLDSPAYRTNPHDPQSPWYRPTNTPVPSQTPTRSFTITPTPSATPTFSQTPTATITPLVYYDAESGPNLDNVNRVYFAVTPVGVPNYAPAPSETSANGDPGGPGFHLQLSMAAYNPPLAEGIGNSAGASVNVAAYPSLSIWIRSGDGCVDPAVMIHSPGAVSSSSSVWVTATAYTLDHGFFDQGAWKQVIIPLSAFNGTNFWGANYNLAANGYQVDAVAVAPNFPQSYTPQTGNGTNNCFSMAGAFQVFPYNAFNCMAEALDVDDVQFTAATFPGSSPRIYPATFDAFVNQGGITEWATQWSVVCDAIACTSPASAFSFPASGAPPADVISSPYSGCLAGHIAGTLGAAAGDATPPCTSAANQFSYALMTANFLPGGGPANLSLLPGLPLTAGRLRGLSWVMKKGPTGGPINYKVVITKASTTASSANYYHLVTDAQLTGAPNWASFSIDFPTTGAPGTDFNNSFGQPTWAAGAGAAVNWDTSDVVSLQIAPDDSARGQTFDVYVDHFQFY